MIIYAKYVQLLIIKKNKSVYIAYHVTLNNFFSHVPNRALKDLL